jgi:hypothetical protein
MKWRDLLVCILQPIFFGLVFETIKFRDANFISVET